MAKPGAMELIKNYKIWFLIFVILASALLMIFNGLRFGIDFEGGTMFQIHLSKPVEGMQMEEVANVIERRLNWSGLQDVRVYAAKGEFIFIVIRSTSPEEVKRIESLIAKQGHFEAIIDGQVIFTGSDLLSIDTGTNAAVIEKEQENLYKWWLPFVLSLDAGKRFRDLTFHKCEPIVQANGSLDYDCEYTYFFIDRPVDSIIICAKKTYEKDKALLLAGTTEIPEGTRIEKIVDNIGADIVIIDENSPDSYAQSLAKIAELATKKNKAIVDASLGTNFIEKIKDMNLNVKVVESKEKEPWIYTISGIRSIVRLTPSITGNKPYIERKEDAEPLTNLVITGSAKSYDEASNHRQELKIILNSGALPVSVESISTYEVSPTQGKEFLVQVALLAVIVLITVSLVIVLRYRRIVLSLAIIFTAIVEAFVTTTVTSALGQSLDIATMAGIIAAVGTGVDDQIVITDELLSGALPAKEEELSRARRVKRAFFIVIAAASTTMATMLPIIIFGQALVKIVGFAYAAIIGVLVGVLVTRPAYGEIVKYIV